MVWVILLCYDSVLPQEETKTKLFLLDSSISSKLFSLEVQLWVILLCYDSVLPQEETKTKLFLLDSSISSNLFSISS